jgi:hypothetical protein
VHKFGMYLFFAGAALELVDMVTASGTVVPDANLAITQATVFNFNRTIGPIHISYLVMGTGLILWKPWR